MPSCRVPRIQKPWALQAEQLLPLLPSPALLAAQSKAAVDWLRGQKLCEWREMSREVLTPEKAWWEQACPKLKISGEIRVSTPPPPVL